ncbi:hypothetical protein [Haematobacter missouriensis]|nr:hypothetical protein [Haematobacter missouriensis]
MAQDRAEGGLAEQGRRTSRPAAGGRATSGALGPAKIGGAAEGAP